MHFSPLTLKKSKNLIPQNPSTAQLVLDKSNFTAAAFSLGIIIEIAEQQIACSRKFAASEASGARARQLHDLMS